MGGLDDGIAQAGIIPIAGIIRHDHDDVWGPAFGFRSREFGIRFSGSDRSVRDDGHCE